MCHVRAARARVQDGRLPIEVMKEGSFFLFGTPAKENMRNGDMVYFKLNQAMKKTQKAKKCVIS